jgi:hypothetical protein
MTSGSELRQRHEVPTGTHQVRMSAADADHQIDPDERIRIAMARPVACAKPSGSGFLAQSSLLAASEHC